MLQDALKKRNTTSRPGTPYKENRTIISLEYYSSKDRLAERLAITHPRKRVKGH
jgi:hypothetical protein